MRAVCLLLFLVLPGLASVAVSGYHLSRDWPALITAFARLEKATLTGDLRAIAAAQAYDQVYRLNCFADGVGVMLGAILFGIGVHGLCLLPRKSGSASNQAIHPAGGVRGAEHSGGGQRPELY